jgi:hypothetical protein
MYRSQPTVHSKPDLTGDYGMMTSEDYFNPFDAQVYHLTYPVDAVPETWMERVYNTPANS